jgi:hypothetical protein
VARANKKQSSKRKSSPPKMRAAKTIPADACPPLSPSEAHFVRGVLTRGEAAVPDASGELPPKATHEIVSQPAEGLPQIKRRKFTLR